VAAPLAHNAPIREGGSSVRRGKAQWAASVGLLLAGAAVAQDATFTIGPPGCVVVNPNPRRNERIHWSGGCRDGFADGSGVLQWYRDDAPVQRYEGRLVAGKPEGHGAMSYSGGAARYDGEFRQGKRQGHGVLTYPNGMRLTAEFDNGEPAGPVQVSGAGFDYEGGWLDGKPHGRGRAVYPDGRYEGQFNKGVREGRGAATFANGNVYDGEWKGNQPDGQGAMVFADGTRYEGGWRGGRFHGEGVLSAPSGERSEGRWEHGTRVAGAAAPASASR